MAEEQSEETKTEARQFMSDLVSSPPQSEAFTGGDGIDMAAWKTTYDAVSNQDASSSSIVMEKFWSMYDPGATSIWTTVYDEADSNDNLDETIAITTEFMKQTESIRDHCFGVMHTLESLEIKGLWIFNGPDPEQLFGANEDSSWFTWSQLGPEANDYVKKTVAEFLTPTDGKLEGKMIKDTQVLDWTRLETSLPLTGLLHTNIIQFTIASVSDVTQVDSVGCRWAARYSLDSTMILEE